MQNDGSPRIKASHAPAESDPLTEAHRRGRHAQIERNIRSQTRELLLDQGLDVLNYVEGPVNPRKIVSEIRDTVPTSVAQVRQQLQQYNDTILKRLLSEYGKQWDSSAAVGGKADAINRVAAEIYNYEL